MNNVNAAKVIIENIQLLEQAENLLGGEVSEHFFNTVDAVVKQTVDNFEADMISEYNFYEGETWFLSTKWQGMPFSFEDHKTWKYLYAFYELTNEGEGEENNWMLSNFFENDIDRMCFHFVLWRNGFNKSLEKEWKKFVGQLNENYPQIEQLGFKFNEVGSWYLPIASLDKQAVIENYESGTLEDALTPITEAIDIIKQVHPLFDEIVQETIAKFGRIENEE